MTRTGIAAKDIQPGDTLHTFQLGRIDVKTVAATLTKVTVTTVYGYVWITSPDQLVGRVTFA